MKLTSEKHPFLSLFAWIFAIFIVVPGGLGYSGFCWSEKRWLSDEELIRHEVTRLINRSRIVVDTSDRGWQHYSQIKKYNSAEDFLEKNPNCCKVGRYLKGDYWPPTFWDRVTGYWGGIQ